jgi:hypothetical protein
MSVAVAVGPRDREYIAAFNCDVKYQEPSILRRRRCLKECGRQTFDSPVMKRIEACCPSSLNRYEHDHSMQDLVYLCNTCKGENRGPKSIHFLVVTCSKKLWSDYDELYFPCATRIILLP